MSRSHADPLFQPRVQRADCSVHRCRLLLLGRSLSLCTDPSHLREAVQQPFGRNWPCPVDVRLLAGPPALSRGCNERSPGTGQTFHPLWLHAYGPGGLANRIRRRHLLDWGWPKRHRLGRGHMGAHRGGVQPFLSTGTSHPGHCVNGHGRRRSPDPCHRFHRLPQQCRRLFPGLQPGGGCGRSGLGVDALGQGNAPALLPSLRSAPSRPLPRDPMCCFQHC